MRNNHSYSSYRSRARNERTVLLKVFMIILPFLIIAVIGVGIFLAYRDYEKNNPTIEYSQSATEAGLYTAEEQDLLVSVIDEDNPLSESFVPELVEINEVNVNSLLYGELQSMISAAEKNGYSLKIKSGYVSYQEQKELNRIEQQRLQDELEYTPVRAEAEAKKTVPQAGCSENQTGLVLCFYSSSTENFPDSTEYQWLLRNANEYGFVQRYSQVGENAKDPAIFRFVGVENAMKMRSFGMNLDEYSVYLSQK